MKVIDSIKKWFSGSDPPKVKKPKEEIRQQSLCPNTLKKWENRPTANLFDVLELFNDGVTEIEANQRKRKL